jgi:16S rRNA processing protein RimM
VRLVVGRIGRAHGVSGEVAVAVRTDDPDTRFAPGSELATEPPGRGPLGVAGMRWHSGRLLIAFVGVDDRTAAEALRGVELVVDTEDLPALDDPDEYYDHQLVGLTATRPDGTALGRVSDVIHGPAGALLAVRGESGSETLIPFVAAIVPSVDLVAGRLTVDPPEGLLDL